MDTFFNKFTKFFSKKDNSAKKFTETSKEFIAFEGDQPRLRLFGNESRCVMQNDHQKACLVVDFAVGLPEILKIGRECGVWDMEGNGNLQIVGEQVHWKQFFSKIPQ